MWSPLADRPPRSVAPSVTSSSHQSERFGGIWMPTSGIRRRHSRTRSFMSSSVIGVAQSGASPPATSSLAPAKRPFGPARPRRFVGDLGHLATVVTRMGDEVLEDHLLEVAVARVDLRECLERGDPLLLCLADADEDAARERDPKLCRPPRSSAAAPPGAWSASRRGRSPSGAPRSTRASAPARRSPRAAGPGPRAQGRRGSCAAGARARARARTPRPHRRRSRRGPRTEGGRRPRG